MKKDTRVTKIVTFTVEMEIRAEEKYFNVIVKEAASELSNSVHMSGVHVDWGSYHYESKKAHLLKK